MNLQNLKLIRMDTLLALVLFVLVKDTVSNEYVPSSPTPFTVKPVDETIEKSNIIIQKSVQLTPQIYPTPREDDYVTESSSENPEAMARHKSLYVDDFDRNRGPRKSPIIVTASSGANRERDSYLDAYAMSHGAGAGPAAHAGIGVGAAPGGSSHHIAEPDPMIAYPTYHTPQYAPPKDMYPPTPGHDRSSYYRAPHYGHPPMGYFSSYDHHTTVYGPPHTSPAPVYGPPIYHGHHDYDAHDHHESVPYMMGPGFFDKLKMKFSWYMLGKIMLKLILFKKFVKFVALLCLMFFIPKLKKSSKDDSEDYRSRMLMTEDATAALMQVFAGAMEAFSSSSGGGNKMDDHENHGWQNKDAACQARKMLDNIDQKYSFSRLLNLYDRHIGNKTQ